METVYVDPSKRTPIRMEFMVNRAARITFNLLENGVQISSTAGMTWQLVLKKNRGDRLSIWSLTLGSGLRYEVYDETQLIADVTAEQNNIETGEYYLQLIRTDLAKTWVQTIVNYSF